MPTTKIDQNPSELLIEVSTNDLRELFIKTAVGMVEYLYGDGARVSKFECKEDILAKESDLKTLLTAWLNAILTETDNQNCCFNEFLIRSIDENNLTATIYGRKEVSLRKIDRVSTKDVTLAKNNDKYSVRILIKI